MNQQQKDEQKARGYAEGCDNESGSFLSRDLKAIRSKAFLAGIQYARNEAREESVKSFESLQEFVDLCEPVTSQEYVLIKQAWLACAQSMEAKHREEIERLKNDLLDAHQEIDILKAYAKVDREESISLGNENFKLKAELAERDKDLLWALVWVQNEIERTHSYPGGNSDYQKAKKLLNKQTNKPSRMNERFM